MSDDSLIPRAGRSHLIGGHVVGRRDLACERGLATIGQGLGPGEGERRSSIGRGRGRESCRVPARDALGLENVCGKMFPIDGSSEVDVATRLRRHHARRGRPRGPHPERHDGHSQCGDLRGEWHTDQSCTSSQGRTEDGVQNSTLRAEALC
jgi:hypothetical protein